MVQSAFVGHHSESPDENAEARVGLVFVKTKAFSPQIDDAMAFKSKIQLTLHVAYVADARLSSCTQIVHTCVVNMSSGIAWPEVLLAC